MTNEGTHRESSRSATALDEKPVVAVVEGKGQAELRMGGIRALKRAERWILLVCVGLIVAGYALTKPLPDFVEYWTSAHEFVAGRSPYSLSPIFQLERALGWAKPVPLMNLTPPWALPLIVPIGPAKSYAIAWVVWVSVLAFIVWWSTKLLLTLYGSGRRVFRSESWASEGVLGFTFLPALICLKYAQITPFALLGLTGFLWFERKGSYGAAGLCLALAAIKPQLLFLFWLALMLWSWRKQEWRVIASFVAGIAAMSGAALLPRGAIFGDYWQLLQTGYMRVWASAFGSLLRFPFRTTASFPLQFVAPALGLVWFGFYWRRHGGKWEWQERMPMVVTMSVLTTCYGWTFDEVLLIIPIVAVATHYAATQGRLPQKIARGYTALNIGVFLCVIFDPTLPFVLAPLAMALLLAGIERKALGFVCQRCCD